MIGLPSIKISDYDFNLPPEFIAKYPAEKREESKLLIYDNGNVSQDYFNNIETYLQKGDNLVANNTKVFQARFKFKKTTGAEIEIFCLEPVMPANYEEVFSARESCEWKCFVGNAKRWKDGLLKKELKDGDCISAEKIERIDNYYIIKFSWDKKVAFADILQGGGVLPIPPYLKRSTEEIDNLRYQTVYSKQKGSVAAPTAGLHFTDELIADLKANEVNFYELTLHVGAGTFKPVEAEDIREHVMHNETFSVSRQFVEKLKLSEGRVISVGTTSARTLESLYWIAHMISVSKINAENYAKIFVDQWYAYNNESALSRIEALNVLGQFMDENDLEYFSGSTQILIMPSYTFKMIDGLITNFHLPKSTLLLLIAAFIGTDWKGTYDFAIQNNFRFLSYGDSSILFK